VIAAAGAGSRMGAIKALLDLGGLSALERIAGLGLPGFELRNVVVVGHAADEVAREAERLGLAVARNENWEQGQTGSVQTGLAAPEAAGCSRFLLHPVDLPLISSKTYELLAGALLEAPPEAIVATSVAMRRGHPLVFGPELRAAILALPVESSIRDLVADSGAEVRHLSVNDSWIRRDLDRPEDLAAARAYLDSSGDSGSP
jgi:CTP:molybdopterin cytidylyltransferase MocA